MSGAVPAYGASSWDRGLAVVVHVFGCYFLCLRCPSNTSAADVVVMAAVMVVNVVVGIVKHLYMFRHIYVYIIELSNWLSVLACRCLGFLLLSGCVWSLMVARG